MNREKRREKQLQGELKRLINKRDNIEFRIAQIEDELLEVEDTNVSEEE